MRISDWRSDVCSSDLEIGRGRAGSELAFRFAPKDAPAQIETVDELARHTSGRKARRDDNVEAVAIEGPTVAPELIGRLVAQATSRLVAPDRGGRDKFAVFPSGSLRYGGEEFHKVGVAHGGGWDVDGIAEAYRKEMGDSLRSEGHTSELQSTMGIS